MVTLIWRRLHRAGHGRGEEGASAALLGALAKTGTAGGAARVPWRAARVQEKPPLIVLSLSTDHWPERRCGRCPSGTWAGLRGTHCGGRRCPACAADPLWTRAGESGGARGTCKGVGPDPLESRRPEGAQHRLGAVLLPTLQALFSRRHAHPMP